MSDLDAARDNPFPPKDPDVWAYCPACGAPLFAAPFFGWLRNILPMDDESIKKWEAHQ